MLIKWINRLAVMYRNRKVGVNSNQVDKAMRPPQNHDYECKKIVMETLKFNVSELIEFVKKEGNVPCSKYTSLLEKTHL